jgi:hypothetical protein
MLIDNKFNLEQIVYLVTDNEQKKRMVTAIQLGINGLIYQLTCGTVETWHYAAEMSVDEDVTAKM